MMISSPEAENGNMDKDKDRDVDRAEDTVAGTAAVAEQARRRGQVSGRLLREGCYLSHVARFQRYSSGPCLCERIQ